VTGGNKRESQIPFLGLFALLAAAGLLTVCLAEGGLFNRHYVRDVKEVPREMDSYGQQKQRRYRWDEYRDRYGRSPADGMEFEEIPGQGRYELRMQDTGPVTGFWLLGIGAVCCVVTGAVRGKRGIQDRP
jgi:hypothetical protein